MNLRLVVQLLSVILLTLALAMGLSFAVGALGFGETDEATARGWAFSIAWCLGLAGLGLWLGRRADHTFFRKEALAVIGLGWLLASQVGALPYLFLLPETSWADAFFESASGLTTTGASVYADIESFPRGLLFWRCLSQWIGGLGVVVFFVAILSFLGAGAKILYSNEASAHATDLETARVQEGVKRIALLYLGLSLACFGAYLLCGLGWFDATCHMFATVSTGGFGTQAASLGAFQSPALEWVAVAFMAICGTSFPLVLRALRGDTRALWQNTELRAYYGILLAVTGMLTLMLTAEMPGHHLGEAIRAAAFQAVSIMTTTGFSTTDYTEWLPMGRMLLLLLMIAGGCAGSTAGGCKVIRLVAASRICTHHIERAFRARVVRTLRLNGRIMPEEDQDDIMTFLIMMAMVSGLGILLLSLLEHQLSPPGVLSAVFASLCNIGPGLAEVGPAETYGFMGTPAKLLLSLLMIMGRLELYAILVLFAPSLWKRFH